MKIKEWIVVIVNFNQPIVNRNNSNDGEPTIVTHENIFFAKYIIKIWPFTRG
jgi:hypothetical protein